MTNLEHWRHMTSEYVSPDSFIDMGFYTMIGGALQRRIWLGHVEQKPIFANMFVTLVCEAGGGKSLVIYTVKEMLKYHRKELPIAETSKPKTTLYITKKGPLEQELVKTGQVESDLVGAVLAAQLEQDKKDKRPQLFPTAPDSMSLEKLLQNIVKCQQYIKVSPPTDWAKHGVYFHKSMVFCMDELSTIFNRDQAKTITFLQTAYNSEDYDYETKHQGEDHIRKMCITILAGTTPKTMQRCFKDEILDEGFASRSIFVFEFKNRFERFLYPALNESQLVSRDVLLNHLLKLSKLVGPVTYTQDAYEYLREYFEVILPAGGRVNADLKLNTYYNRKNLHAQKLAMSMHFSESTEMVIDLPVCQRAIEYLNNIERRMHYALNVGTNPLARIARDITQLLKQQGPKSYKQLYITFFDHTKLIDFDECISNAIALGNVQETVEGAGKDGTLEKMYSFVEKD